MTSSGFGKALDEPPSDSPAPAVAPAGSCAETRPDSRAQFERLRELLLGDERRALEAARARIAELEQAQKNLPQRLPGAAIEAMRGEQSTARVADALSEPVAQALGAAVRNNRESLIDALFPIIGPMIRKSIAEALRTLVIDLNAAIESSFTPRGLKWRVEAWRAGVPYAQIVLKHRLSYRIDHVFLIERGSGLVLLHEAAPELAALDADAIAGMLTALGDFVGDSVGRNSGDTLESARVGEHLVWVVEGPRANLACFMRGVPPAQLRSLLEQRLEGIHAQGLDESGSAAMAARGELLQPLALQAAAAADAAPPSPRSSRWPLLLIGCALLLALGWFVVSRERWGTRIDVLRAQLVAHPGFVLTGIDAKPWRSLVVHGLLDADAEPLETIFHGADLGGVVPRADTTAYVSGADAVVARRAARLLAPPPGVQLAASRGALNLVGSAPAAWIAAAHERAGWIPGVTRVDFALTPSSDAVAGARAELERVLPTFAHLQVGFADDSRPLADSAGDVEAIVRAAARAGELARVARVELVMQSIGTTDASGSADANAQLRDERALWLAQALAARGIGGVRVAADSASARPGTDRRGAHLRVTIAARSP